MRLPGAFNSRHLAGLAWRGLPILDGPQVEAPVNQRVKRAKECFDIARMSDQSGAADGILTYVLMDLYVLEEVGPVHLERAAKFNPETIAGSGHGLPSDSGVLGPHESASAYI
jgi:hypothetical protein